MHLKSLELHFISQDFDKANKPKLSATFGGYQVICNVDSYWRRKLELEARDYGKCCMHFHHANYLKTYFVAFCIFCLSCLANLQHNQKREVDLQMSRFAVDGSNSRNWTFYNAEKKMYSGLLYFL